MQELAAPKQDFILSELWSLAWAASVQRANLYSEGSRGNAEFRAHIKTYFTEQLLSGYKIRCSEDQHYNNIGKLVAFGARFLPSPLVDGRYKYGVAQKLLNLALKYYWCLGCIEEPPHCPVDRIIIDKTHLRGSVNWTEIKEESEYRKVIEAIKAIAGGESLARWELLNYQRR